MPYSSKFIYNLVGQLKRTPTQISIFEFLELSPTYKKILENSLHTTSIPKDIDADQFETMVNNITTPHYLYLLEEDDKFIIHPYNLAFHIEVMIPKTHVRRVLIDEGDGINIWLFNLLKKLGLLGHFINPRNNIIIKDYDEEGWSSNGLVFLTIHMGRIEKDVVFRVLDILYIIFYLGEN